MPEEMDLIKTHTIKRYIKEILDMKSSKTVADDLRARFNELIKQIIREASKNAKKDDRTVIMPRDMEPAVKSHLGAKYLTEEEIFKQIKRLNPIQIGSLTKQIEKYIQEEKQKKS